MLTAFKMESNLCKLCNHVSFRGELCYYHVAVLALIQLKLRTTDDQTMQILINIRNKDRLDLLDDFIQDGGMLPGYDGELKFTFNL